MSMSAPIINEDNKEDESCQSQLVFEFKIDGMTCVNCSTAIENGLTAAFKDKGLVQDPTQDNSGVNVVLLMHKMRITFFKDTSEIQGVTAESIASEVEDLGFGAELINRYELLGKSEQGSARGDDEAPGSVKQH